MSGTIRFITLLLSAAFLVSGLAASDEVPPPKQDHPIILIGGTIYTISGEVIENGEILFDDGKIVEVGTSVSRPANAEIIETSGKAIYPGFIITNSILGLTEIGAVRATRDFQEVGSINPNVHAARAYNPDSEHIPVTRTNGIALAHVVPTGGLLSGTSAVMMLDGWTWEDALMAGGGGVWMSWPEMVVREAAGRFSRPRPRAEQLETRREALHSIEQTFDDAEAYRLAKKAASGDFRQDLRLESLLPVLEKKVPLYIRASHVKQIETAVNWVNRRGYRMVLVDARDSWMVIELLKANAVPVIISSVHSRPARRWQAIDEAFTLPATLAAAGIKFAFSPGRYYWVRNLPFEAGTAVGHGLPREAALKALTLDAASILGVADQVGSLEAGKDATLMVVDGDPLEIRSSVEMLYIQGREIDLGNRHRRLNAKYQERYRQLGIIP